MSYARLPATRRHLIEQLLTPKQLDVFRDRLNGHSWRTIADAYRIDEATARGHMNRALRRIQDHQETAA